MEKIVSFDKQGRLYIPEDIRKSLDSKTLVLRAYNNALIIEAIDENPIAALGKLGKEKLKGKSIKLLRKKAMEEIKKNAINKIRRL